MDKIMIVMRREFNAYFNSAIAYIFVVVFLVLNSAFFMNTFFLTLTADMRGFFGLIPIFLAFFIPAITMRLWAEERKLGTIELLLTLPIETYHIVIGKFLASLAFLKIAIAGTLIIPIMLAKLGTPDWGPIIGGYFGTVLLGGFFLSIGLFVSGLFEDQISAFILSMILCLFFLLVGYDFIITPIDGWVNGLGTFLKQVISMKSHFDGIERGVLSLKDIFYFLTMTGLFLTFNIFSLEGRKY